MSFVFDLAAAQQVGALGKYNQSVQNRNALITVSYTHLTLPTILLV